MDMASSKSYSAVAPASLTRTVVRWAVLGAAGVIALFLALSHSMAASAAAPPNCVRINFTTCVVDGTAYLITDAGTTNVGTTYIPAPAPTNSGYPPNTVIVPPYFDNIYGWVEVVTDSNGVLIDVNPFTGQRIFPFTTGFVGGFIPNFVLGNVTNVPFLTANICGQFGCPGAFNTFNRCNFNVNCGTLPAGAVYVGNGTYFYNDNNACRGDGRAAFVVGRGYYCRNGDPLFGGAGNVFFRPFEVSQPATAPVAAPVTAAPVVTTTTTTVAAPAVVEQPPVVAAPANTVTALTAPQTQAPGGGNTHILSAPDLPAPSAPFNRDDKG